MRNLYFGLIGLLLVGSLQAQQSEVVVPFSNPDEGKYLKIKLFNGTLTIKGADRNDILVKYEAIKDDDHEDLEAPKEAQGLRKISDNSMNLSIGEKGNKAYVKSENWARPLNLTLEVPRDIELDIEKNMGGQLDVSDVHGDINAECAVGSISIDGVRGIVNASTAAGEIAIVFDQIPQPKAMMITNQTGNIDLTLPSDYKADLKMKTGWGEIYSDLDIETLPVKPEITKKDEEGEFKVVTDIWTHAKLNGGGDEVVLKSMMGNIYLRKK